MMLLLCHFSQLGIVIDLKGKVARASLGSPGTVSLQ